MHLVIVSRRFPPHIGGAERALARLADGLARRDHQVTVLTEALDRDAASRLVQAWRKSPPGTHQHAGMDVVPLVTSRKRFWGTLRWMCTLRSKLQELAGPCDLIYVSMLKHSAYVALDVGRRCRVPVVLRPSGTGTTGDVAWQARSLRGLLIRRRCRGAAALVAVSPQMRDELVGAGYPENAIQPISGGVPVPEVPYDPRATAGLRRTLSLGNAGSPLAVYVGRFSPEKGLDELLDAWERVTKREPPAQLALVGEGPLHARLAARVRGCGLQEFVHFCDATADPDLYLRAADLLVLPSHYEGMSNALLEAMALGLPAVATDIAGNRAVAEHDKHALLVPAGNAEAMARAVLELLADPDRRRTLGQNARLHAAERFDIERVLDDHEQLFEQLAVQR